MGPNALKIWAKNSCILIVTTFMHENSLKLASLRYFTHWTHISDFKNTKTGFWKDSDGQNSKQCISVRGVANFPSYSILSSENLSTKFLENSLDLFSPLAKIFRRTLMLYNFLHSLWKKSRCRDFEITRWKWVVLHFAHRCVTMKWGFVEKTLCLEQK